jgi:hypothetical protein
MLVARQDGEAVDVLYRHHRTLEAAIVPGRGGALLALDRVGVNLVAREPVTRGDKIGGNALRHEIRLQRDRGVHRPGTAGCADTDAAHGFDAAADRHIVLAGHHLRGGKIHRIQPGGAKAVDLHARHAVAIPCHHGGGARDVATRLAHRIDAAKDHVIDQRGIKRVAVAHGFQRLCRKTERRNLMQ